MRPRTAESIIVQGFLVLMGCCSAAPAADFIETFEGLADPSSLSAAGWLMITGTNNPTTVSPDFSINNNQNINKITAINDAGSQFTSAHVFLEHDYWTGAPGDNGNDPNNFGRGDAMIYTYKHLTQVEATSIDMNGAYVAVDHANGNQFNGGPSFYFTFRLGNGSWWIYESGKLGQTTAQVTHAMLSTDPMDNTFTFIPLIRRETLTRAGL